MTPRGLIPLTAAWLMAAGTWDMAVADDEPTRLIDKVVLSKWEMIHCKDMAFSRDGKTLFVLGHDCMIRLWDVASEKNIGVLKHGFRVAAAAYSPNGKFLATAGHNGFISIWDAGTYKKVRFFEAKKYITRIAFSSDSKIVSAAAQGELHTYLVKNGELLYSHTISPFNGGDMIRPVAFTRPIKRPMMVCDNQLYEAEKGRLCYRLTDDKFRGGLGPHVAITSDERKMASGCQNFILIWDLNAANEDPAKRKYLVLKHPRVTVHGLAFSPNDQILAVGYQDFHRPGESGFAAGRGGVLLFEVASGKLISNQNARIAAVHALAFSPDGRLLATADDDWAIKLWDVPAAWRKLGKEAQ